MPRPYGWIRGEGTVKNQRWGLGSIMDTPFLPSVHYPGIGDITIGDGTMSNPDPLQGLSPDWYNQLVYGNSGPPASAVSGSGTVVFTPTTSGVNWLLIGGLALGGYLLLRR